MSSTSLSVIKRNSNINSAMVYLATLAPSGRHSMYHQLRSAIRILGSRRKVEDFNWGSLCYADMIRVRSRLLEEQKSVHTVNLCLAALKGVAQCAFHLGEIMAEQVLHIKAVKRVPSKTVPTGQSLNTRELRALFRVCKQDRSIRGIRDAALLAVMVSTGLRRAEIAALEFSDYDESFQRWSKHYRKNGSTSGLMRMEDYSSGYERAGNWYTSRLRLKQFTK